MQQRCLNRRASVPEQEKQGSRVAVVPTTRQMPSYPEEPDSVHGGLLGHFFYLLSVFIPPTSLRPFLPWQVCSSAALICQVCNNKAAGVSIFSKPQDCLQIYH